MGNLANFVAIKGGVTVEAYDEYMLIDIIEPPVRMTDEEFSDFVKQCVAWTAIRTRAKLLAEIEAKKPSPEYA